VKTEINCFLFETVNTIMATTMSSVQTTVSGWCDISLLLAHTDRQEQQPKVSSAKAIDLEHEYSAHKSVISPCSVAQPLMISLSLCSYHPLPVVFSRASGAHVWDPEENEYIDMLSAYS
jgi:hypothetical protein